MAGKKIAAPLTCPECADQSDWFRTRGQLAEHRRIWHGVPNNKKKPRRIPSWPAKLTLGQRYAVEEKIRRAAWRIVLINIGAFEWGAPVSRVIEIVSDILRSQLFYMRTKHPGGDHWYKTGHKSWRSSDDMKMDEDTWIKELLAQRDEYRLRMVKVKKQRKTARPAKDRVKVSKRASTPNVTRE